MPSKSPFDPISFYPLQQRKRDLAHESSELAPGGAAMMSSPFRPTWSISCQAIAPKSSPHHHGQKPSRNFKNRAQTREIAVIFSNSGRRVPSPIPLSPAYRRPPPLTTPLASIPATSGEETTFNRIVRKSSAFLLVVVSAEESPFTDGIAVKERRLANSASAAAFSLCL
uniref:Uncharacterized protein n=1 Tax=Oryza meridionalis TaxID=40149 RepID=A0A0E0EBN3_9ORYZ